MRYLMKINKKVRYIRVYTIVKRVNDRQNIVSKVLTSLMIKIFNPKAAQEHNDQGWANEE
ncbi:MAG: hypothetical protein ACP5RM_00675 [Candidatus Micrarchaeia archaeon]